MTSRYFSSLCIGRIKHDFQTLGKVPLNKDELNNISIDTIKFSEQLKINAAGMRSGPGPDVIIAYVKFIILITLNPQKLFILFYLQRKYLLLHHYYAKSSSHWCMI